MITPAAEVRLHRDHAWVWPTTVGWLQAEITDFA